MQSRPVSGPVDADRNIGHKDEHLVRAGAIGHIAPAAPAGRSGGSDILVIKFGALGDVIMAMGALQAIRRAHRGDRVVLLTTRSYLELAKACGYFDEIWIDPRQPWWRFWETVAFVWRLRGRRFTRVYDLQWNARTNLYFQFMRRPRLEWVGVAPGCRHRYRGRKDVKHITERHAEMLALTGIYEVPPPDLSFLRADLGGLELPPVYALIVPGSAANRLGKRWPLTNYIELCKQLAARGLVPILVCGPAETEAGREICAACPEAVFPETRPPRLAELARGAAVAVGNDTGPLHLIAAVGCPTIALFGPESDPVKTKPLGRTLVLQSSSLADIAVSEVLEAVATITKEDPPRVALSAGS